MTLVISNKKAQFLYLLLTLVYVSGLFIPLMESDSAQHATMAMRMYLKDDFVNLYRGFDVYLDKPHMHFWLSAISFKLFGVSYWSYRLPAVLMTILGAFSCYKLAILLYGNKAGHIASLIFLSAQAIILANHDVRTDAVMAGAVIFSVWQWAKYIEDKNLIPAILGGVGAAVAFSTKGQLAIFIIGSAMLCFLLYNRKWQSILNWKFLVGIIAFFIACLPMLYAYNEQFGVTGIQFIFWDQSFNRLTGTGQHKANNTDYFFFFHTLLWAFLPWAIITYMAIFSKTKQLLTVKFSYKKDYEFLTIGGFWLVMLAINASKSKLPHYMNSLLPIIAVLTAGYLVWLLENSKERLLKIILRIQYFITILGSVFILFLLVTVFELPNVMLLVLYVILLGLFIYAIYKKNAVLHKIMMVSVLFSVFVNVVLNTYFYPNLLKYQGGNNAVEAITENNIPIKEVYILDKNYSWSLNFLTERDTPSLAFNDVNTSKGKWLFVYGKDYDKLKANGLKVEQEISFPHFRVTRLSGKFLNPKTRHEKVGKAYLVKIG